MIKKLREWALRKMRKMVYVTSSLEYDHEWHGVYFHGDAEKLFWPDANLRAKPDRVSCDKEIADIKEGVSAISIDYLNGDGLIDTAVARLYLWQPAGCTTRKGLIVLGGDVRGVEHAAGLFHSKSMSV
jgi:hypothetical protein